jgi:hypothetical protein
MLPYCILNEIALQPCGFLAAYMGSALKSEKDLRFRNLGGKAVIFQDIHPQTLHPDRAQPPDPGVRSE